MFHKNHEKDFKKVIDTLKEDNSELKKMVSRKQTAINNYINRLEETQKKLACVKCESEAIQLKLVIQTRSMCWITSLTYRKRKKMSRALDIRSVFHLLVTIIPQCLMRRISLNLSHLFH
ncbi:hypothetical protein HanIR_Chr04g0157781 [Helianthus annuus]|nr:hypothetical protein HanIR_Chr04g0157781 [Helianthus annuus]